MAATTIQQVALPQTGTDAASGISTGNSYSHAITGTPGPEVTLSVPSGGLQAVTVTIPKSAASPGGKLYGRLQAIKLP